MTIIPSWISTLGLTNKTDKRLFFAICQYFINDPETGELNLSSFLKFRSNRFWLRKTSKEWESLLGLHENTILNSIKRLESLGFIKTEVHYYDGFGTPRVRYISLETFIVLVSAQDIELVISCVKLEKIDIVKMLIEKQLVTSEITKNRFIVNSTNIKSLKNSQLVTSIIKLYSYTYNISIIKYNRKNMNIKKGGIPPYSKLEEIESKETLGEKGEGKEKSKEKESKGKLLWMRYFEYRRNTKLEKMNLSSLEKVDNFTTQNNVENTYCTIDEGMISYVSIPETLKKIPIMRANTKKGYDTISEALGNVSLHKDFTCKNAYNCYMRFHMTVNRIYEIGFVKTPTGKQLGQWRNIFFNTIHSTERDSMLTCIVENWDYFKIHMLHDFDIKLPLKPVEGVLFANMNEFVVIYHKFNNEKTKEIDQRQSGENKGIQRAKKTWANIK